MSLVQYLDHRDSLYIRAGNRLEHLRASTSGWRPIRREISSVPVRLKPAERPREPNSQRPSTSLAATLEEIPQKKRLLPFRRKRWLSSRSIQEDC